MPLRERKKHFFIYSKAYDYQPVFLRDGYVHDSIGEYIDPTFMHKRGGRLHITNHGYAALVAGYLVMDWKQFSTKQKGKLLAIKSEFKYSGLLEVYHGKKFRGVKSFETYAVPLDGKVLTL